jgi:hypothetical protein
MSAPLVYQSGLRSGVIESGAYPQGVSPRGKVVSEGVLNLGVVVCAGALTPPGAWGVAWPSSCGALLCQTSALFLEIGSPKGTYIRWGSRDRTPPAVKRQTGGTQSVSQP